MFCNNCGTNISEGQEFCTNCGVKIKSRLVASMKPSEVMPANAKRVPWATRGVKIALWVIGGLIVLSILSSIVLVSLNSAREKSSGTTNSAQNSNWQTYNSVADGFSILVPSYPTYASQNQTNGDLPYSYHTYKSTKGTTAFLVAKYIYQDEIDVSEPDNLLERFLNAFVNGVDEGKLTSSKYTYSGQYRALEFHVSSKDSEDVKGIIVLVGQTPYLIAEDYYTVNYNDTEYQKFITSFSIK